MKILGIDISSVSTGFAVLDDGILVSKSDIGLIKLKNSATHGERLAIFESALNKIVEYHKPDLIAVEDVWAGKFITPALILSRYRGIVEKIVWQHYQTEPFVRTASEFRKTIGTKFDVSLLPGKKEKLLTGKDSKMLTFYFIQKHFSLYDFTFATNNDTTDALAVSLGAHLILSGQVVTEGGMDAKAKKPPRQPKPTNPPKQAKTKKAKPKRR